MKLIPISGLSVSGGSNSDVAYLRKISDIKGSRESARLIIAGKIYEIVYTAGASPGQNNPGVAGAMSYAKSTLQAHKDVAMRPWIDAVAVTTF